MGKTRGNGGWTKEAVRINGDERSNEVGATNEAK